ncbi:MAG TPA: hypothetical protein VGD21_03340 [Lysobacter sp.]
MSQIIGPRRRSHVGRGGNAEAGSALIVVVVLLLLASLFLLFALNVGRFEQQTSGNDYRARLVQELAEAGLHQGVEFFNANPDIRADQANWEQCAAGDDSFPCGAIPVMGFDPPDPPDPDGAGPLPDPPDPGPAPARRATMFRYIGGTGSGVQKRFITLPNAITETGGFASNQQVGAVLCRIKKPTSATDPTACATNVADASSIWVITVVSKGSLTGEGSSATVAQTVGSYAIFSMTPGVPPVIASGSVEVGGGLQIVASPNAGGSGIPVSVWTRLEMAKSGTPNTCYMEEFLRQGGSSSPPAYFDGITVCHTCNCPTADSLSFQEPGNKVCQGMDIVDIDNNEPNDAGCSVAPNLDIRRSEFPPDLFAFIFGTRAWNDVNQGSGGDTYANKEFNFAETRRISECKFPHPVTQAEVTATLPEDTCYLLRLNNITHIGDGVNDANECNTIGASTRGIVWVHPAPIQDAGGATVAGMSGFDCTTHLRNVDDIGTPSHPVALIYDGALTQVHFRMYGLLFVREPNASTTISADTGGTGQLGLNAGATIYGAAVIQGQVTSGGGGTAAIVYNEKVLSNLINDPTNTPSPSSLPGSWTDRVRY